MIEHLMMKFPDFEISLNIDFICNLVQEKCILDIKEFSFIKGYDITFEKVMK